MCAKIDLAKFSRNTTLLALPKVFPGENFPLYGIFKDQPWLLRESGETGCAYIQNSHAHRSIVPFVISARISTYTEVTQTVLT